MMSQIYPLLLTSLILLTACDTGAGESGDISKKSPGWTDPVLQYAVEEYYPSRVVSVQPSPGQFSTSSEYGLLSQESVTSRLLGFPTGGGIYGANSSSSVSLGLAGGSVTLEFDPPIENHENNIGGYDFIVYGNSFWNGNTNVTAEPGIIEVMSDENNDAIPNDSWYLIPGSHITSNPTKESIQYNINWNEDNSGVLSWTASSSTSENGNLTFLPTQSYWSRERTAPLLENIYLLPDSIYSGNRDQSTIWGYADCAPTLILGDLNGDSSIDSNDYPECPPEYFYTSPDTHGDNQIDAGSGGGSAIDLDWAVNSSFQEVELNQVSWIKITSASLYVHDVLGEASPEVDAVIRVRRSQ